MTVKKIGILYHPMKETALVLAEQLRDFLGSKGIPAWRCSAWEEDRARAQLNGTDLIISVGGDGTILRAAQVVISTLTPIIGVNLGKLGFMTELSTEEAMDKLSALLEGEGWIDERAMLEAELVSTDPESGSSGKFYALNDVVAARGAAARMISIHAIVDDVSVISYRADGIIVATATGSTGYALAAGGPILHPQSRDFLLAPVLPHLSLAFSLVLPSTAVVKLGISTFNQATLSIDGHMNLSLQDGATLNVRQSSKTTRFLRIHPKTSFYGSLEKKLKGKQLR